MTYRPRFLGLPAAFVLSVSGCASTPAPKTAALPPPPVIVSLKCPQAGTVQTTRSAVIHWDGAEKAAPDICVGAESGGAKVRRLDGVLSLDPWTAKESLPAIRDALAELEGKPTGTVATFDVTVRYRGRRPIVTSHAVKGIEDQRVTTPAGTFDTLVLQDRQSWPEGDIEKDTMTYWIDRATGLVIETRDDWTSKDGGGWRTTTTTAIELPPAGALAAARPSRGPLAEGATRMATLGRRIP